MGVSESDTFTRDNAVWQLGAEHRDEGRSQEKTCFDLYLFKRRINGIRRTGRSEWGVMGGGGGWGCVGGLMSRPGADPESSSWGCRSPGALTVAAEGKSGLGIYK